MPSSPEVRLIVDAADLGGVLSPLWFGHNLEHTRSAVWRGLSAQMLRNRKFAGKPELRTGQAWGWYPIGPPHTLLVMDRADAYIRHADGAARPRINEAHSQLIIGHREGQRYGIGQDGIALAAGKRYEAALVLKSAAPMPVTVRLLSGSRKRVYHSGVLTAGANEWSRPAFEFTAPATDREARLEVTFEGPGRLAIGAASMLPADHLHGMRPDVIERLSEIGIPLLRWPGGNFAGDYRWQDGLLPVDERAPLQSFMEIETLPHTQGYDAHEIGTDEFIALCRAVGAEPFITVNLAWDSPEDCAAWVEYCNGGPETPRGKVRVARGHPEPYGVCWWSLGNELGYAHMEGPNAPAAYLERARAAAEAMRRADPSIRLVSSGAWWSDAWFATVLPGLADVVDAISHHMYCLSPPDYAEAANARTLIAAPGKAFDGMADIRARMAAVLPPDRPVGIAFDEWNAWYAWYRPVGVVEGIYAATMLATVCRRAAEVGMTLGCYFQPVNEGAIDVEPFGSRLTAIGQAMALFRPHHGNRAVAVRCQGPQELVAAAASLDEGTGSLVLTLVNKDPEEPCRAALRLADPAGALREGVLLVSEDHLPGSRFRRAGAEPVRTAEGFALDLPPLSIARLTFGP